MKILYSRIFILFSLILLVIFSFSYLIYSSTKVIKPKAEAAKFNENLRIGAKQLQDLALKYENVLQNNSEDNWPFIESLEEDQSHFVFIYKNSDLIYWNTNSVYFNDLPRESGPFLVDISNSWYLVNYSFIHDFEIFLIKPIILNYSVVNQYIKQKINAEFSELENLEIIKNKTENCYPINSFGSGANYLLIKSNTISHNTLFNSPFLLLLLYILLVALILSFVKEMPLSNTSGFSVFIISFFIVFCIRFTDWYFGFTASIIDSNISNQELFSVPLVTSLWDLLVSISIFVVFIIYYYKTHSSPLTTFEYKINGVYQFLFTVLIIIIPVFILELFTLILINYKFDEYYFLFANTSGIVIMLLFVLFGLVLYLLERSILFWIIGKKVSVLGVFTALLFSVIFVLFICKCNIIYLAISVILAISAFIIEYVVNKRKHFFFLHHLLYIIIISALFSFIINKSIKLSKNIQQYEVSSFLNQSGDIKIEEYWKKIQYEISIDSSFIALIDSYEIGNNEKISNYFAENYFGLLSKGIDIQITVCSEGEMLNLEEESVIVDCIPFFQNIKRNFIRVIDSSLYLINSEPDDIYYLGELHYPQLLSLYIEFYSFYVPTGLGYAELLVDMKKDVPDLSEFSFAKYQNNILISKFGAYEYHTSANIFSSFHDSVFFVLNDFKHYKISNEKANIVIVSRPGERVSSKMISFSTLVFLFTGFFILMAFLLYGKAFKQSLRLNFSARLQLFFMIALVATLFSTALIIMYYADKNSKSVLETQLNEKAHSVLIELQHKLSDYVSLDNVDKEQLEQLLQKFSLVFFSDINIYDTKGRMVASSRPQIFEEGLLSEMVNPRAFEEIFVDNLLYYNCTERIGDLEYLSSYLPLMLSAGEPAGIINLPYFARQIEQRKSFRLLLFTFINLFVILGIIGTIIAIFYSRLLTKPLTELQKNIANIRIDTQNEKIKLQSDDEIGQLIGEYNKMVDKLEASANILKHSEREIAWREVARQIAHEIKNPLTPMKLNIQYLLKSYQENDKEFGVKIKDISQTLIQQIETLDKVAETFSDMAKSNMQNFSQIDVLAVIKSVVNLFEKSTNVVFEVNTANNQSVYLTKGIEKDLTQVFNNLLKNSVEAVGSIKEGRIEISLSSSGSYHTICITDNGSGIPENRKDFIFTPYFTTRSKGTGLGLAIVKTIITEMGGNIKLESTSGKGTTFILKILKSVNT